MDVSDFKSIILEYTRKISENTHNVFSPICEQYGLTMLQVRILAELYQNESHTIGSLADRINIAGANISAMCKKLGNKGFLERVRDPNDERVVKVALTEKGNRIMVEIDKALDEKIAQYISNEPKETLEDIFVGLRKLNDLLLRMSSVE